MVVSVETNPFKPESPQYHASASTTFLSPTDRMPELISSGIELLRKIYWPGFQYKKTGVILTELTPGNQVQMSLFEVGDGQQNQLQTVVDQLNRKLGQNTVRYASMGMRQTWKMRQQKKTPCYTTHWDELLVVSTT